MEVKMRLDPKVVWRLSEVAESRNLRIEQLVEQMLDFQNSGHKGRVSAAQGEKTRQRIVELHAAGYTDAEIGIRIDRVPAHVGRLRRDLGLPANRRRRHERA